MWYKKVSTKRNSIFVSFFLILIMLIGISFSVYQTERTQHIQSNAATPLVNCAVDPTKLGAKSIELELFNQVNAYRVQNGKHELTWNDTLKQASEWQSIDMLSHKNLSHTDSLGRTPDIRLKNCGYTFNTTYGENIAEGSPNATSIFTAWKNSPPHNTIMLSSNYTIAAISEEVDSTGNVSFWTMDFGATAENSPGPTAVTSPIILTPLVSGTKPTISVTPSVPSASPSASLSPSDDPNEPTPTPAKIGVDIQIALKVKIAGIGPGGNLNPKHLTRQITTFIYGTEKEPLVTGNGFLTYGTDGYFSGVIHLGKLAEGAYLVKIAGDNTLQVIAKPEFQNLYINQVNQIPEVTLFQGDFNKDNILDINDYNAMLPCFQNNRCDKANNIDFNDDGRTDVTDYNLLLQSFEQLRGN